MSPSVQAIIEPAIGSCYVSLNLEAIRRQQEAELKLLEEETTRRVEEAIQKRVEEALNSVEVKLEIQRTIEDGRKKMFEDVTVQLQKEKEETHSEAKRNEEQARREKEELDRMLEENKRKIEESHRRAALEQQHEEEERYHELEALQRQKEEAIRQKKLEEEQQRAEQMKLLGKNKARPKLSFALGFNWSMEFTVRQASQNCTRWSKDLTKDKKTSP
eukprot:Gb_40204 [translate_table: standard]